MGCFASSLRGNVPSSLHHREVHITLAREGGRILGLRLTRDSFGIVTRGVDEGSIMAIWNREHPAIEVGRGDRIISVNGIAVDSTWNGWCAALTEFRKNTVHLVVQRSAQRLGTLDQGPQSPQPQHASSLDRLLPEGFMDDLPRLCPDRCGASECCICLDELQAKSDSVLLPCQHAFHLECVERWLMQCPTYRFARCPTCRAQIPAPTGVQANDSDDTEVEEGRDIEIADGIDTQVTESRAAEVAEGSRPEIEEGSDREVAEGMVAQVAEGKVTEAVEGRVPEVVEGSGTDIAEGSDTKAVLGCDTDVAEGSDPELAEGSGPEIAVSSPPEDYPLQASV
mmetsp:Transcript_59853/g.165584  ORF Transcript_59853/g.165584 Transcript_59853/m.165584 type:complete len:339 (+) Transcript_59853:85-1101(+)